jgi:hypothetical protein
MLELIYSPIDRPLETSYISHITECEGMLIG